MDITRNVDSYDTLFGMQFCQDKQTKTFSKALKRSVSTQELCNTKKLKLDVKSSLYRSSSCINLSENVNVLKRPRNYYSSSSEAKYRKLPSSKQEGFPISKEEIGYFIMMLEPYAQSWQSIAEGLGFGKKLIDEIEQSSSLLFQDSQIIRLSLTFSIWCQENLSENLKPVTTCVLKDSIENADIDDNQIPGLIQKMQSFYLGDS